MVLLIKTLLPQDDRPGIGYLFDLWQEKKLGLPVQSNPCMCSVNRETNWPYKPVVKLFMLLIMQLTNRQPILGHEMAAWNMINRSELVIIYLKWSGSIH